MIRPLETRRLLLRPLQLSDSAQAQAIFPHWEIVRFLNKRVPWPYPPDGVQSYYRDAAIPATERGEESHWSLRLKSEPGQMIGCISLMNREENNRGFWLGSRWQRQGLISEACEVVTDYWFNELKFSVLRVPKAIANIASRRISEKTGMRVVEVTERDYVSGRLPTEVWEITAAEWQARKNAVRKLQQGEPG
jgi:RimJ/RimL family protein N-acetyltransferase